MRRQAQRPAPDLSESASPDWPTLTGSGLALAQTSPDRPGKCRPGKCRLGKHRPGPAQAPSPLSTRTSLSALAVSLARPTRTVSWRQAGQGPRGRRPGPVSKQQPVGACRTQQDPIAPDPCRRAASIRKTGRMPPASLLYRASTAVPPVPIRSSPRPPPGSPQWPRLPFPGDPGKCRGGSMTQASRPRGSSSGTESR